MLVHKLLNNKSHCTFSLLNYRKAETIFIPCISGTMFFWVRVQVLEVALKLIVALNFSILRHDIYVYNFSSSSISSIRNYTHQTYFHLKVFTYVMIFVVKEVFLKTIIHTKDFILQNNLQSRKQCSFFYIQQRMCVNFLKYSIDFFSTNFIFIDVS